MQNGDIFVNKYCPVITEELRSMGFQARESVEYKQQPDSYKGVMPAYVDRVIITSTPEEPYIIKMI